MMHHRRKHNRAYGFTWDESGSLPAGVRVGQGASAAASSALPANLAIVQSLMRRCVINDAGTVQYYLDANDSTKKADGSAANLDGTDGQVMVEIPQLWLKHNYANNKQTWFIGKEQFNGAERLNAFYKNGAWVTHRYAGAYEGTLYDASAARYTNGLQLRAESTDFVSATKAITRVGKSHPFTRLEVGDKIEVAGTVSNNGIFTVATVGDQTIIVSEGVTDEPAVATTTIKTQKDFANDILCSVSGKTPINDLTRANGRAIAAKRGTGWRQQDYELISAVQLLYLTEYADFESQSMIGNGLTDWTADFDWRDWSDYNPIEATGNSNGDGNATASQSNGSGVTGSYMTYRGIENLFGHNWEWIDGINIGGANPADDHKVHVSNNDNHFADDTWTNYTDLGIVLPIENGFQDTIEQVSGGVLPATVQDWGKIGDYYDQRTGWCIARRSGAANYGDSAGIFVLRARNNSTYVRRNVCVRLAY